MTSLASPPTDALFAALTPRLLRVARRFFVDPEDARDAVQDALLAGLQSLDRYEGRAALSTWFHRILVNTALMELRRRTRHARWIDRDTALDDALDRRFAGDGDPTAEEALAAREESAWLRDQLDALPPRQREILHLRGLDDRSVEETAALLRITPTAVRVRHHRALRALQARLAPPPVPEPVALRA